MYAANCNIQQDNAVLLRISPNTAITVLWKRWSSAMLSATVMKPHRISLLVASGLSVVLGLSYSGCTVKDTIYLQDVSVSGPVSQPAVHINDGAKAGDVCVSTRGSVGNERTVDGHVDGSDGANRYATRYMNLSWNLPRSYFGADFDFTLSRGVALAIGIDYSTIHDKSFLGGNTGLGFLFHGEVVSGRFDVGIQLQNLDYDSRTVVEHEVTALFSSSTSTDTIYFHDIGNSTLLDYYFSLTINSNRHDWPVNFLAQISLSKQSLTDYRPSTQIINGPFITHIIVDTRAQSSATFLMMTPGIYINLGNSTRMLAGLRIAKEVELTAGTPDIILMPLLQFDIKL
jgi:hypothetical protein